MVVVAGSNAMGVNSGGLYFLQMGYKRLCYKKSVTKQSYGNLRVGRERNSDHQNGVLFQKEAP